MSQMQCSYLDFQVPQTVEFFPEHHKFKQMTGWACLFAMLPKKVVLCNSDYLFSFLIIDLNIRHFMGQ